MTKTRANFKVLTAVALLLCAVTSSVEATNQTQAVQVEQQTTASLSQEAEKHHSHHGHSFHHGHDPTRPHHSHIKKGRMTRQERRPSLSAHVSLDPRMDADPEQEQAERRTMSMIKEELANEMEPEYHGSEYEEQQDPYRQSYQGVAQYEDDREDRYLSSFNPSSFAPEKPFMTQELDRSAEEDDEPGQRAAEKIFFRRRQAALQQSNAEIAAERAALKVHKQRSKGFKHQTSAESASSLANELSDSIDEEDSSRSFQAMAESDRARGFGFESKNTANIIANAIIHQKQQQSGMSLSSAEEEPELSGSTFSERLKLATHSASEALESTNSHPIISSLKEAHSAHQQEVQKRFDAYNPVPMSQSDNSKKDEAVRRTLALMKGTPAEPNQDLKSAFPQPAAPSTENAVQKTLKMMGFASKSPAMESEFKQPIMPGPAPQAAPVESNPIEKKHAPFSMDAEPTPAPKVSSHQATPQVVEGKAKKEQALKDEEPSVKIEALPQGADVEAMLDVEARQHRALARAQQGSDSVAPPKDSSKDEAKEQKAPEEPEPIQEPKTSLATPAKPDSKPAETDSSYKNAVSKTLEAMKRNEVAFPQPYIENKNASKDPHAATDLEDLRKKKTSLSPDPEAQQPVITSEVKNATDPHAATNLEDLLSKQRATPAPAPTAAPEQNAVQKTLELIKSRQEPEKPKEAPKQAGKEGRADPPVPFLSASEAKEAAAANGAPSEGKPQQHKDSDSSNFKIVTSKLEVDDSMIKPVAHAEPEHPPAPAQPAPKTLKKKVEKPKQEEKNFEIETTTMESDDPTPVPPPQTTAEVKNEPKQPEEVPKKKAPAKPKAQEPVSFKIETTVATPQMIKRLVGDNGPDEEEPEAKAKLEQEASPANSSASEVKPIVKVLKPGEPSIIDSLKAKQPEPSQQKEDHPKSAAQSKPAGLQNTPKAIDFAKASSPQESTEKQETKSPEKPKQEENNQQALPQDVFEAAVNNTLAQPASNTSQAQKGEDIKIEDARKSHDMNPGLKTMLRGLVDTIQPALQEIQSKHKAKVQVVILDDNNSSITVPQATLEKMAEPQVPAAQPQSAPQQTPAQNKTEAAHAQQEANKTAAAAEGIDEQYLHAVKTTIEQTKQKEEAQHKDAVEKTLKLAKIKQEQEERKVQEMLEQQEAIKKHEEEEARKKAEEQEQKRSSIIQKTIELAKHIQESEPKPEPKPKAEAKVETPKETKPSTQPSSYQNAISATLSAIKNKQASQQASSEPSKPKGQTNEEQAAELAAKLVNENPQNALKILEQKEEPKKSEQAPAALQQRASPSEPAKPTMESVKNTIVQKTLAAIQDREEREKHPLSGGLFKHFNVQTGIEETPLPPNATAQVTNASKTAMAAPVKNSSVAQGKTKPDNKTALAPKNESNLAKKPVENKTALATPQNKSSLAAPASNKSSLTQPKENKTSLTAPATNKSALTAPSSNKTALSTPKNSSSSLAKKPENKTSLVKTTPTSTKTSLTVPQNKSSLVVDAKNTSALTAPASNKSSLTAPSSNKSSLAHEKPHQENKTALSTPKNSSSLIKHPENKSSQAQAHPHNASAVSTPKNATALAATVPSNKSALTSPTANSSSTLIKVPENKSSKASLSTTAPNKTSLSTPSNKTNLVKKQPSENKTALSTPKNKTSLAAPATNKTSLVTPSNKSGLATPATNQTSLAAPAGGNKSNLVKKAEKPMVNTTALSIKTAIQKNVNKSSLASPKNESPLLKTVPSKNASSAAQAKPVKSKTSLAAPATNKSSLTAPSSNKTALSTSKNTSSSLAKKPENKTSLAPTSNKTALSSPKNSTALVAQPSKKENNSKLAQVDASKSINSLGSTLKSTQALVQEDLEKQDAEALAEKQKQTSLKQLGKNALRLEMQKEAHWLENSFAQMSHKMKSVFSNLFMAQKSNDLSNQDKMELFNDYLMLEEEDEDQDSFDE